MTALTRELSIDPEIDRALDAIIGRYPAIEAHERFIRDRLAELAQHAYQAGEHAALSSLIAPSIAAVMVGVDRSHLRYLSRKYGIGWDTGSGHHVYRPEDIERLRQIRAENRPGTYPRHKPRLPD